MEKEQILENNKLIAVFMGWKEEESGYYPHPQYEYDHKGEIEQASIGNYQGDKPLYMFHKSWDWLMPVVDKIFTGFVGNNEDWTFRYEHKIREGLKVINIEETWSWVVEFIKWKTGKTLKVTINEDLVTAKEINPLGLEPDEDYFDRYPLPICFDPLEEQKELWKRKMNIEREWKEAEENLKSFDIGSVTAKNGIVLAQENIKSYFTKFNPESKYKAEILPDGKINILLD